MGTSQVKGSRAAARILHQQEAVGKRNTGGATKTSRKENAPSGPGRFGKAEKSQIQVKKFVLRLGGRRLLLRRGTALHRIGLVVEADDVLGDVNLGRGEKKGSGRGGRIQDHGVAVLARVAVEYVDHLAADAVDDLAQRGIGVFLQFIVLAVELCREALALRSQPLNFVLTALALARGQALPKIVNLLVHVFNLGLARRELRLQFGLSLLPFGGAADGPPNINHADLARRRAWGR